MATKPKKTTSTRKTAASSPVAKETPDDGDTVLDTGLAAEETDLLPPEFLTDFEKKMERLSGELRRSIYDLRVAAQILALGSDRVVSVPSHDHMFQFHLPQVDRDVTQKKILLNGVLPNAEGYNALALRLPKGGVYVDVGGYLGVSASFFSRICLAEEIHIFEPQSVVLEILKRNIALNEVENTELHSFAIMDTESKVDPGQFRATDIGATPFLKHANGKYRGISLDSMEFEKVDVLNMEFSGPKMLALEGASDLLDRCKPFVIIDKSGRDLREVIEYLAAKDYRYDQSSGLLLFYPEAT